jgi:hypothetical protein
MSFSCSWRSRPRCVSLGLRPRSRPADQVALCSSIAVDARTSKDERMPVCEVRGRSRLLAGRRSARLFVKRCHKGRFWIGNRRDVSSDRRRLLRSVRLPADMV